MYSDWRSVPIPSRLAARPTDARGYPVPALVMIDSHGVPDFRATDSEKWVRAYKARTCAMCGQPMGRHLAFIGGPLSHQSRYFTDLPAHKDCAEYALKVCPYLAAPSFKYAETLRAEKGVILSVAPDVSTDRPEKFMLGITTSCVAQQTAEGTIVVQAAPWDTVTWWKEGERVL